MTPNKLTLQTRRPNDSDPAAVEFGWWIVSDGHVHLVDQDGNKTGQSRSLKKARPKGFGNRNAAGKDRGDKF